MRAFIRHPSDIPINVSRHSQVTHAVPKLHDVSIGGLCFTTAEAYENGRLVDVVIPHLRPPFSAAGRVVWCGKDGDTYIVGVQFLDANDVFQARMVEQVCHIEQYRAEMINQGKDIDIEQAAREWIESYAADFPGP